MTTTNENEFLKNPRKRGRDSVEEREVDAKAFTIKPDPSEPFAPPRTFIPLCLLSRSQLPLAYLNTGVSGSRLFTAHVAQLEAACEHDDDATVLVATEMKERKLYVIERVKTRLYALCRLGTWVKEEDVVQKSRRVVRDEMQIKRRALQPVEKGKPWWMNASVEMPEVQRPGSAMDLRFDMRAEQDEKNGRNPPVCEDQQRGRSHTGHTPAENEASTESVQSPTDLMQELAKQYLQALYLSRTSLAYFVKGPLSRTRAAFAAMSSPAATTELVGFLRDSILTSSTMDKKFKDGVPTTVKELPVERLDSPQEAKKSKRRRKWKSKRDKQGFFADEKEALEQWWRDQTSLEGSPNPTDTADEALRKRIPRLRTRETFLQVILILETLTLEVSLSSEQDQNQAAPNETLAESQATESQAQDTQLDVLEKKSKSKKKQNLPSLLETLLDKLCIWHSLESHSPAKKRDTETDHHHDADDELKSFCIEVVIPFYISRIPQHASIVNKKLGGPSAPTPMKRKAAHPRKPGEATSRPLPERKPRKPLSRVATDSISQHAKHMPSLNRSATDTAALSSQIKREASEVSLNSIPALTLPRKPRQSLMQTLDSSRRQVDLSAMSQANDAKMQKQAEMREKMQSAINMLKKPNRAAALAEMREETDESFAKATAAAKTRHNIAAPKSKGVSKPQIAATPSHRRSLKATPYKRSAEASQAERLPSSGTSHVPSSSAQLAQAQDIPSSTYAVPQTGHRPRHANLHNVNDTPSRGFAKFMPAGLVREPGTLDSPTVSRKIAATPSKPARRLSLGVSATPNGPPLVAASPNVQRTEMVASGVAGSAKSIYDSLGWDGEEYEELT